MIVIGDRIKSRDALPGFGYKELLQEADRREVSYPNRPTKQQLLDLLSTKDVLYHSPHVLYLNGGSLTKEDIDSRDVTFDNLTFKIYLVGVTTGGDIVTLDASRFDYSPKIRIFRVGTDNPLGFVPSGFPESKDKSFDLKELEAAFFPVGVTGTHFVYTIGTGEKLDLGQGIKVKSIDISQLPDVEPAELTDEVVDQIALRDGKVLVLGRKLGGKGKERLEASLFEASGEELWRNSFPEVKYYGRSFLLSPNQFAVCGQEEAVVYTRFVEEGDGDKVPGASQGDAKWETQHFEDHTELFGVSGNKLLVSDREKLAVYVMNEGGFTGKKGKYFAENDHRYSELYSITITRCKEYETGDHILELPDGRVLYTSKCDETKFVVDTSYEDIENRLGFDTSGSNFYLLPVDEKKRKRLRDFLLGVCPLAEVLVDVLERFI